VLAVLDEVEPVGGDQQACGRAEARALAPDGAQVLACLGLGLGLGVRVRIRVRVRVRVGVGGRAGFRVRVRVRVSMVPRYSPAVLSMTTTSLAESLTKSLAWCEAW